MTDLLFFWCVEGCKFEGERAYQEHIAMFPSHHPVPIIIVSAAAEE